VAVATRRASRARAAKPTLKFDQRLVLNRYMLGLFGVESFEELALGLKEPEYELTDEENVTQLMRVVAARFPNRDAAAARGPSDDDLLRYDANIVRHTRRIGLGRGEPIRWKYFQYLALLFAEIYLDRYFTDADALRRELNKHVEAFNEETAQTAADEVDPYDREDIHKLAFWMATGSGKTLLMHANILQYLHYLDRHNRRGELNRIILLTPNAGLSSQHLTELRRSGIEAELFDKDVGRLFLGQAVEILDIHKLAETMGEKTVAVDAFEGDNLVLVDEGHRGSGGEDWKDKRDRLCADGFSFEYSATFGQAIKAANKPALTQEYAKCILFDYSYRYFYDDGYGKDYQILNLDSTEEDKQHRYLTASLLAFYQQLLAYEERAGAFEAYGLERPLWIFVGGSVTASTSAREKSDIEEILFFAARFLREREESVELLDQLLSGRTGITYGGLDVFANKYGYLTRKGLTGPGLYDSIREKVFNATSGTLLRIEELKGADGELALRVGDHQPFGVINVGDAGSLRRLLETREGLSVGTQEFSGSLFDRLNERASRVHLLIGSKKFTEGWNSYRVSSMGLMNIGRSEGAQIIQLFGRGVRLQGLEGSLKRSTALAGDHPADIRVLETLNVYGVRADYMERFKEYLVDEGLPTTEGTVAVTVPVQRQLPDRTLKAIRIGEGGDFKRDAPRPTLGQPPEDFVRRPIQLDWYAKVQALTSAEGGDSSAVIDEGKLQRRHLAFMDVDAIYFELVRYKNERGRYNLSITRQQVVELLRNPDWYMLTIPRAELEFPRTQLMRRVRMWEEIAVALLKKYVDRYYKQSRDAYELPFREYYAVDGTDSNFIREYRVEVAETQEALLEKLREVKWLIEADMFEDFEYGCLEMFTFDRHLYTPLVHATGTDLKTVPKALNEGERDFLRDLRRFYEGTPTYFAGKELYLLRNLSRGKGIGFFEAGNFYPDFILWLLVDDQQYVTFIDPKGIARMGLQDPKIEFYQTIKDVETGLGDPEVILNSFIVSNTRYAELSSRGVGKEEYAKRHVLFQKDDKDTYIETMLGTVLSDPS